MGGGMNERMNQLMNKIDLFPIAAFPRHTGSSVSLLLRLVLQKRDRFTQKGRAVAKVKCKGLGGRWTWVQIQAQPRQLSLLNSVISLIYKTEIRLPHRVIVLGGLSNA